MQVNSPNGSLLRSIAAFFRGPQQQQAAQVQPGAASAPARSGDDRSAFSARTIVEPPTGGFNPNARRGTYVNILV